MFGPFIELNLPISTFPEIKELLTLTFSYKVIFPENFDSWIKIFFPLNLILPKNKLKKDFNLKFIKKSLKQVKKLFKYLNSLYYLGPLSCSNHVTKV